MYCPSITDTEIVIVIYQFLAFLFPNFDILPSVENTESVSFVCK